VLQHHDKWRFSQTLYSEILWKRRGNFVVQIGGMIELVVKATGVYFCTTPVYDISFFVQGLDTYARAG
jgi:hypothetical protein